MAKNTTNWTSWILKFVGSLAYLYVVWWLWQVGVGTGVLSPVLFGFAVVFSVSFFIMTLVALTSGADKMKEWSMKSSLWAGVALIALTAPTTGYATTWLWLALVGFVLAYVGNGMDKA